MLRNANSFTWPTEIEGMEIMYEADDAPAVAGLGSREVVTIDQLLTWKHEVTAVIGPPPCRVRLTENQVAAIGGRVVLTREILRRVRDASADEIACYSEYPEAAYLISQAAAYDLGMWYRWLPEQRSLHEGKAAAAICRRVAFGRSLA